MYMYKICKKQTMFLLAVFNNKQTMQLMLAFLVVMALFLSKQVVANGLDLGFGEGVEFFKGAMQGDVGNMIAMIGLFAGGIAMLWWNWRVAASVLIVICLYLFLPDGISQKFTVTF